MSVKQLLLFFSNLAHKEIPQSVHSSKFIANQVKRAKTQVENPFPVLLLFLSFSLPFNAHSRLAWNAWDPLRTVSKLLKGNIRCSRIDWPVCESCATGSHTSRTH